MPYRLKWIRAAVLSRLAMRSSSSANSSSSAFATSNNETPCKRLRSYRTRLSSNYLVKDDDVGVVEGIAEAVKEFVARSGLAVDVVRVVEAFEDAVESLKWV